MYGDFGHENFTSDEPLYFNNNDIKHIGKGIKDSDHQHEFDIFKPSINSEQSGSDFGFSNFEKQIIISNSKRDPAF